MKMKNFQNNANYWKKRFEVMEQTKFDQASFFNLKIEEKYLKAQRELDNKIYAWYKRFAVNNNISMADAKKLLNNKELAELKWDIKEYIKYGHQNELNQAWMQQLENASARFHISRLEALKIQTQQSLEVLFGNQTDDVDSLIRKIYQDGYYHTLYEVQKGFKIGWDVARIDQNKLDKIIKHPWASDGKNFSKRIWDNRSKLVTELHNELTQMIMLGKAPDDAIKNISNRMRVSKNNVGALVMTESAFFSSAAQKDAFQELDVEEYEVVATLDSRTSEICRMLDGFVGKMEDYKPGETAPPFHVRCRTTTAPHFRDEFAKIGERAARDENGKTYYVPANMSYRTWKNKFVKEKPKVNTPKKKVVNFKPANTIKEAEDYARNNLGIKNVSYKGVDVTTANAWNEGLQDSFERFPELKNCFGYVGEARARNKMVKPAMKQTLLDSYMKNNPGISAGTLEPYVNKSLRSKMRQLSVSKDTFAQSWSPTNDMLKQFRGVSVNGDWGKDSVRFIEALKTNVKDKFHPVGCDSIKSILDHEIGHQLDDLLDIKSIDTIQELFDSRTRGQISNDLSVYTWNNGNPNKYSEMIAEGWTEYCNNPKPREMAKVIGKTIETEYKKKFGKR